MKDRVYEVLKKSDKPLKAAEIATMMDVDKSGVDKAIKALKKEAKIFSPKACFYAPSEEDR